MVVIIAVILGISAGVFSTAFMKGMTDQRIESAIENEVSHLQVHHPDYLQEDKLEQFIPAAGQKIKSLRENSEIAGISNRLKVRCMITAAGTGSGVLLSGIDPEHEKQVTDIHEHMVNGSYFEDVPGRVQPLVIGQKLAEKLNAKLKSRIVIRFADVHGNPVSIGFRVTGIYKTDNTGFDKMNVYARYDDLQPSMGIPDGAGHEVAVYLHNSESVETVESMLEDTFEEQQVSTWREVSPELSYLSDMMDQYMYVIVVVILLALLFGIINTMLMAVLERIKELGMLMAIGMNRRRVFSMIMLESVFLTLTGGLAGILLAWVLVMITGNTGIDISMYGTGLEAMGWSKVVYPSIDAGTLAGMTGLVILTGIVSAIYPALKALRLNPAESIRTE
jgi:ABC-type lipoprotein release transport system permease subunit